MELLSDGDSVVGSIQSISEKENGEGRMELLSDGDSVVGSIQSISEKENGEWRMSLQRNSSPFPILHSPICYSKIIPCN